MRTSLGLDENIEGALCYVAFWITGIIFLLLEKDNPFVRFHAMQSIITFLGLNVISILLSSALFVGRIIVIPLLSLIRLVGLILWIVLIIKAYQGEMFKLPIVGDLAVEWSRKI